MHGSRPAPGQAVRDLGQNGSRPGQNGSWPDRLLVDSLLSCASDSRKPESQNGPEDLVRNEITNCAYTHLLHAESSNMNGLVTHLLRVTNRCYKLDACRCERCIATQC